MFISVIIYTHTNGVGYPVDPENPISVSVIHSDNENIIAVYTYLKL